MLPIYLDYMATTPVDPRVARKMLECLEITGNFGNADSRSHYYGEQAALAIESARQQVADLVNCDADEIIWTSGATEANNLALKGASLFYQRKGKHLITLATEHKSVLNVYQFLQQGGFEVTYLKPAANGLLDLHQLEAALRDDTILVSVMHVNNEIGVIQDLRAIGELLRTRGILFHVDAAQSAGKIPIDLKNQPIDLMSFSAHKIYGPKGIGALFVRQNPRIRLEPLIQGGGQERGLRAGTLPTHQIVAMGEAFRIAQLEMTAENERILQLHQYFWQRLQTIPHIFLNGDPLQRIAGNLNVSFDYVDGEALIMALSDLAVSSGAACTSASIEPSHVLMALGCPRHLANSAIRFCLGRFTTQAELDTAFEKVKFAVQRLRAMSPIYSS